jgi:hypothetical protein
MTPTTVYLRTEAGRIEIHEKKSGLTQSERLVLIMIDGVANCDQVQQKLSSLTAERFSRAIKTLLKKELISEVFLQVEDQAAEEIDQSVVERYLHQDPLDPVTIISFHPDDEFEEDAKGSVPIGSAATAVPAVTAESVPELTQIVATPAIDVIHAKLADELHDELAARNVEWKRKQAEQQAALNSAIRAPDGVSSLAGTIKAPTSGQSQAGSATMPTGATTTGQLSQAPIHAASAIDAGKVSLVSRLSGLHWGYWLIASGSAFILVFLIMKLLKA